MTREQAIAELESALERVKTMPASLEVVRFVDGDGQRLELQTDATLAEKRAVKVAKGLSDLLSRNFVERALDRANKVFKDFPCLSEADPELGGHCYRLDPFSPGYLELRKILATRAMADLAEQERCQ